MRVDVQPRVLGVLIHLAAHPDELVTKDALAQAVWKGQDASDEVIARAVMKPRRALGEDAHAPRHILTETGEGFRFRVGLPTVMPRQTPPPRRQPRFRRPRRPACRGACCPDASLPALAVKEALQRLLPPGLPGSGRNGGRRLMHNHIPYATYACRFLQIHCDEGRPISSIASRFLSHRRPTLPMNVRCRLAPASHGSN